MTDRGVQYTQGRVPQTVARQVRQRAVWDVALTIVLIVLTNAAFVLGALFAVFSVAFIDSCPAGCDSDTAVSAQVIAGAVLALVALIGTVLSIVALVRRRRGWWIAFTALLIVVIGWVVSFLVFAAALGTA